MTTLRDYSMNLKWDNNYYKKGGFKKCRKKHRKHLTKNLLFWQRRSRTKTSAPAVCPEMHAACTAVRTENKQFKL